MPVHIRNTLAAVAKVESTVAAMAASILESWQKVGCPCALVGDTLSTAISFGSDLVWNPLIVAILCDEDALDVAAGCNGIIKIY
jgi:hypothetical protein